MILYLTSFEVLRLFIFIILTTLLLLLHSIYCATFINSIRNVLNTDFEIYIYFLYNFDFGTENISVRRQLILGIIMHFLLNHNRYFTIIHTVYIILPRTRNSQELTNWSQRKKNPTDSKTAVENGQLTGKTAMWNPWSAFWNVSAQTAAE